MIKIFDINKFSYAKKILHEQKIESTRQLSCHDLKNLQTMSFHACFHAPCALCYATFFPHEYEEGLVLDTRCSCWNTSINKKSDDHFNDYVSVNEWTHPWVIIEESHTNSSANNFGYRVHENLHFTLLFLNKSNL